MYGNPEFSVQAKTGKEVRCLLCVMTALFDGCLAGTPGDQEALFENQRPEPMELNTNKSEIRSCACIYIYIYILTNTYICIFMYTYKSIYIYACTYI